jgi:hypothetical protein
MCKRVVTRRDLTSAALTQATPDNYCANSGQQQTTYTTAAPSKRLNIDPKKGLRPHSTRGTMYATSPQKLDKYFAFIAQ